MARIRQHLDKVVAPREEHVGGAHPYKKNKNKCFLGVDYIL
jgi:hypothetical protein